MLYPEENGNRALARKFNTDETNIRQCRKQRDMIFACNSSTKSFTGPKEELDGKSTKLVRYPTCHLKLSQICSIGDKSGDQARKGVNMAWLGAEWQHMWLKDVMEVLPVLPLGYGPILGVTVYRKQWNPIPSYQQYRRVVVIGSTRNGPRETKCPSARGLTMFREDKGARSEGAAYVWTMANQAVGSMQACCMMRRYSRRLVCRGGPEACRRINNVSSVY
ncbi:hypothetical protein TNCV_4028581 [Trichonephila clavipes]|nr:hypothetical protein TNCV_4028581 [Trichonephila clavipes]